MNKEQLEKGNELIRLIETTKKALENLKSIEINKRECQKHFNDNLYNFHISEHSDGSGFKAELSRYYGNEKLLKVIINELEMQLNEFNEKFNNL